MTDTEKAFYRVRLILFATNFPLLLGKSIRPTADLITESIFNCVDKFWSAFPFHPIDMLDAVIELPQTIVAGLVVAPITGMEAVALDFLKEFGLKRRVWTLQGVVTGFSRISRKMFNEVTLTDPSGFVAMVVGAVAGFFYRTFKKFSFWSQILKRLKEWSGMGLPIDSEILFSAWAIQMYKSTMKKLSLIRVIAIILAPIIFGVLVAGMAGLFFLAWNLDLFEEFALRQDSRRVSVKKGHDRIRVRSSSKPVTPRQ